MISERHLYEWDKKLYPQVISIFLARGGWTHVLTSDKEADKCAMEEFLAFHPGKANILVYSESFPSGRAERFLSYLHRVKTPVSVTVLTSHQGTPTQIDWEKIATPKTFTLGWFHSAFPWIDIKPWMHSIARFPAPVVVEHLSDIVLSSDSDEHILDRLATWSAHHRDSNIWDFVDPVLSGNRQKFYDMWESANKITPSSVFFYVSLYIVRIHMIQTRSAIDKKDDLKLNGSDYYYRRWARRLSPQVVEKMLSVVHRYSHKITTQMSVRDQGTLLDDFVNDLFLVMGV